MAVVFCICPIRAAHVPSRSTSVDASLARGSSRAASPAGDKLGDTAGMRYAVVALALSGCVTTAGIVKKQAVSLPVLIGAAAADFAVTAVIAWQAVHYSTFGSVASGIGFTGADVA